MAEYRQEHVWWDSDDNEFLIEATWDYIPDEDPRFIGESVLLEIECLDGTGIDHLLDRDGDIWRSVERDGFKEDKAVFIGDVW